MIHVILFCFSLLQSDVPYKAPEEYAVKFSFTFHKRGEDKSDSKEDDKDRDVLRGHYAANYSRNREPLPFMQVSFDILKKHEDEIRIKIVRDHDNVQILKKKIKEGMTIPVFSEFVDDIKDQISGYNHTVYFLNEAGDTLRKVVIEFDEEGFYLVNGKKKGKL